MYALKQLAKYACLCESCFALWFRPLPDQLSRGDQAMRGLSVLFAVSLAVGAHAQSASNPCPNAQPVPQALKLPAFLPPGEPVDVEKQLLAYLNTLEYRNLGWCRDKWVRDTGPLIQGTAATVHPAVHIYYSPEVSKWLVNGRKGDIPDGAVIIKEQFSPVPATRYRDIAEKDLGCSNDWTIMIKNSKGAFDGWFWAEVWNGSKPSNSMNLTIPFNIRTPVMDWCVCGATHRRIANTRLRR